MVFLLLSVSNSFSVLSSNLSTYYLTIYTISGNLIKKGVLGASVVGSPFVIVVSFEKALHARVPPSATLIPTDHIVEAVVASARFCALRVRVANVRLHHHVLEGGFSSKGTLFRINTVSRKHSIECTSLVINPFIMLLNHQSLDNGLFSK